ncbi:MAG TPA: fatty acid desaturase [Acetobacteraceae bacterium]|jgi:fatty acid desaturase|nr:fatty acid desaturase [Acetobacteraceae bacterium]
MTVSVTTVSGRVLSPTEVRALSGRTNADGAMRLGIHGALLLGTGWLVAIAGPWTLLPAMLALGLVQVALFAPAHETMHQTAFASRRANAIVGWLTSCPSLLNAQFYAAFHLAHHRHTQVPGQDPELDTQQVPTSIAAYVRRVLAIPYWRLRLRVIADCWRNDLSRYPYVGGSGDRIIASVRAMSLTMAGGSLASAVLFGWMTPFEFWIIPQLIGQPILRAYLLAEHTGCTLDRNGLTNTRTTLTNAAVRLLMWNMPFHAEHHLYPSIPFHRLADAHLVLRERLGFVQPGYVRWNLGFVRQLLARDAG